MPRKPPADKIEFAVVLLPGGKMSPIKEYAIGSTDELIAPWRNLKTQRSVKEDKVPFEI